MKTVVVSVSLQSVSSLATKFCLPASQTFRKLASFFKSLGTVVIISILCV